MNKNLLKVFSLMTSIFFLTTTVRAEMVVSGGLLTAPGQERPAFLQVEIPAELASVEDVFEAPSKENPQMILHIQNIHGNYESQVQISRLLSYLYEKYGFKLLFAEGAADKLNPDLMRFFPDAERNKKLADLMARNGELTGIEYYLIDGPKDVEAVGIEEAALYRQNYEAFKTVYRQKAEIDRFLSLYEARLENLGSRIFSPNTRKMLGDWKKFEAGHRDFLPYVKQLCAEAKSVLNLDLESLFAQVEWPQITRLIALQSMEKDLDRKAAEKDKQRLLGFLKEQQVSVEMIKAIETLDEKKITMSSSEAERRKEDLPRFLFERLVDEAGPKGFKFHDYPAFSLWAGHLILQNELDSRLLFEEIEKVFTKILSELTVTEREKDLLEIWKDEILLRKLMHLEVVRKEWERAVYRKEWVSLDSMVNRLKKISADAGTGTELSAGDWTELQSLAGAGNAADKNSLREALQTSYDFYDFARQRESVFFDIIKKTMAEKQTNKAVLVTGGFHTDGLMEMFRENEINASVLMPRITGEIDNSGYVSTMLENKPSILEFKTQTLEEIAHALPGFVQVDQGRTPEGIISGTLRYVIEVGETNLQIEQIREIIQRIAAKYYLGATSVEKVEGKFVVRLNMNVIGFPLSSSNDQKTISQILTERGVPTTDIDSIVYVPFNGERRMVGRGEWDSFKVDVPPNLSEYDWNKVQLQITFRSETRDLSRRFFLKVGAGAVVAAAGVNANPVSAKNEEYVAAQIWNYAKVKLARLESKFAVAFKEDDASDKDLLAVSNWKEQIDLRAEVMSYLQKLANDSKLQISREPLSAKEVGEIAKALGEFSLKEASRLGAQTTGVRGAAIKNPANELRRSYLEGLVKLSLGSQALKKIFNRNGRLEFDLSSPLFFDKDLKEGFDPAGLEKDMARYGEVVYTIAVLMGVEKVYSVDEVNLDFSTALARVWAGRNQKITLAEVAGYFSLVKFVNANADTMTLDVMARKFSDPSIITPAIRNQLREAVIKQFRVKESQEALDKRLIEMAANSMLINDILGKLPEKESDFEEVPVLESVEFFYKLADAKTLSRFKEVLESEGIDPLLLSYSVASVKGKGALQEMFEKIEPLRSKPEDLKQFREYLKSYSLQHINPGVMGWQRDELEKTYSQWKAEVSAARNPQDIQAATAKLERKIQEFYDAALTDLIHRNPKLIQSSNNFADIILHHLSDNEFNRLWILSNHLEYLDFIKPLIAKKPGLIQDLDTILRNTFNHIDNTITDEARRKAWGDNVVKRISDFLSTLNNKRTSSPKRSEVRVSAQQDGTVAMELGGLPIVATQRGLVVNGILHSNSGEARSRLSLAANNRGEQIAEAQRQLDALKSITPKVRALAQEALTAMAGASRSRIIIPGQEEKPKRAASVESASAAAIPVGYSVFQMVVTPQGVIIPQPSLSVAAVAGGLLTNLDELNSLASALGNLQNPASSTLNAALLEGTLLAPTKDKMRMLVVLDLGRLAEQDMKQVNDYIAKVLISFENTKVKIVIVDSSLKGSKTITENVELIRKMQDMIKGRLSIERVSSLKQLEKIRTQFMHTKDKVLELHITTNESAVSDLLTDPERTYALVLGRSESRIVEKIQQGVTVGFATLADRLKQGLGLFVKKIGSGVTFINSTVLSGLKLVLDSVFAAQKVQMSA